MTPILYKKTAKKAETETTNGLGFLTECVKCEVTEERNGIFEAELQYPTTGRLFSELGLGSIVKALASDGGTPQLFRIYKVGKTINGIVTYSAEHISYDLINLPISGLTANAVTAQAAMRAALAACPLPHEFEAYSDIGTKNTVMLPVPCGIRTAFGGAEGSILDTWGGEFEFDNFSIHLWAHRGKDSGVLLRYGKNITDFRQEENLANCYTHVFPYAIRTKTEAAGDGQTETETTEKITLSENVIELPTSSVGHTRVLIVDLSDQFDEEEPFTASTLRKKAEDYIAISGLTAPEVNMSVSFIALWQTEEYKDVAALERVKLCDEVSVYFEPLGVKASAEVVKTVYDTLLERYSAVELGTLKPNFADSLKNVEKNILSVKNAVENTTTHLNYTSKRVTAEEARAKKAEEALNAKIAGNAKLISEETLRAQKAEEALDKRITQNENNIAENTRKISDEITRAQEVEEGLRGTIENQSKLLDECMLKIVEIEMELGIGKLG